jgi:hypothetical protein
MANEASAVGALSVRFLVEADDADGSAADFECYVPDLSPAASTLAKP